MSLSLYITLGTWRASQFLKVRDKFASRASENILIP